MKWWLRARTFLLAKAFPWHRRCYLLLPEREQILNEKTKQKGNLVHINKALFQMVGMQYEVWGKVTALSTGWESGQEEEEKFSFKAIVTVKNLADFQSIEHLENVHESASLVPGSLRLLVLQLLNLSMCMSVSETDLVLPWSPYTSQKQMQISSPRMSVSPLAPVMHALLSCFQHGTSLVVAEWWEPSCSISFISCYPGRVVWPGFRI